MTRQHTIICFIILALTAQEIKSSSLETLAWASQNGEVPIHKDYDGFYVDVDLSYNPSSSLNTSRMLLSLTNDETLLPSSCSSFNSYYCSQHNCTEWPTWVSNIDYPSFSATASHATSDAYLDYGNWNLKTYAYIAKNCSSGSYYNPIGSGRGGVIGLGNNNGSWQNYKNSTVFSIYFDKSLSFGKLLFRYESSLSATKNPVVVQTDANYRISFTNGYISVSYYTYYFSGSLVFDPHAKAIGFPLAVFNTIVSNFRSSQGVYCSGDYTNPSCNYVGYISKLPTLKLSVGSGVIELPPSVYVKNPTSNYTTGIVLNLQALSPTLTGSNYVTPSFKDAVIMDAQFMTYYYLVFNRYRVSFYVQGGPAPSPSSPAGFIIFGVVSLLLVISVCTCLCKKKKKIAAPSSLPSQDHTIIQPSYNPVLHMQPNNGYVYPPQNNYPVVHQQQYVQQPAGYAQQQPGYYQPPLPQQQFQQPGYVNYGE